MSALNDARESLRYWESRLERLPRTAIRKRREARLMAARWRERVSEAERVTYGAGLLGAVLLFVAERRLPTEARYASRKVARTASRAAVAAFVALAVVLVAAGVAVVELLAAIVRAL
jgi:uncharacterized membrane protein